MTLVYCQDLSTSSRSVMQPQISLCVRYSHFRIQLMFRCWFEAAEVMGYNEKNCLPVSYQYDMQNALQLIYISQHFRIFNNNISVWIPSFRTKTCVETNVSHCLSTPLRASGLSAMQVPPVKHWSTASFLFTYHFFLQRDQTFFTDIDLSGGSCFSTRAQNLSRGLG